MIFPNDPTNGFDAHQMFVAVNDSEAIVLYSISSIIGKEKRVYDGKTEYIYFRIEGKDQINNNFLSPSFIDCSKAYSINTPTLDLSKLKCRNIDVNLRERILNNIDECKKRGVHVIYSINESDLKKWNNRL